MTLLSGARRLAVIVISTIAIQGCGSDSGDEPAASTAAAGSTELTACPESAWQDGGGTDYRVAGEITCKQLNDLLLEGFPPPGAREDSGFLVSEDEWVCASFSEKPRGPIEFACANGESQFRYLVH